MTEEQLKRYIEIGAENDKWWGWEDGYTWEEGSDHFMNIAEQALQLLGQIAYEGAVE